MQLWGFLGWCVEKSTIIMKTKCTKSWLYLGQHAHGDEHEQDSAQGQLSLPAPGGKQAITYGGLFGVYYLASIKSFDMLLYEIRIAVIIEV